jgi:hypothetical protein
MQPFVISSNATDLFFLFQPHQTTALVSLLLLFVVYIFIIYIVNTGGDKVPPNTCFEGLLSV